MSGDYRELRRIRIALHSFSETSLRESLVVTAISVSKKAYDLSTSAYLLLLIGVVVEGPLQSILEIKQ